MNIKNLNININKLLATLSAGVVMLSFSGCSQNIDKLQVDSNSNSISTNDNNDSKNLSLSSQIDSKIESENDKNEIYEKISKISSSTGIDFSELYSFIENFSKYAKLEYYNAVEITYNSLDRIKNEYNNPKAGIMCCLFDYSIENNILRKDCPEQEMIRQDTTNYEKEDYLIKMCDNYGMNDTEKDVVLSVFRTKMNTTTTNNYYEYNNFDDSTLPNGELCRYETPKYGLYEAVCSLKKHIDDAKDQGIYTFEGIINYLSNFYGGQDKEKWIVDVTEILKESKAGYSFGPQNNMYV